MQSVAICLGKKLHSACQLFNMLAELWDTDLVFYQKTRFKKGVFIILTPATGLIWLLPVA